MYLKNLTNTPFGTSPEAFRGLPGLFQFWVPLPKAGKSAVAPGRTTDANQGKGGREAPGRRGGKSGNGRKDEGGRSNDLPPSEKYPESHLNIVNPIKSE